MTRVLLTGGSGFIAAHVLDTLLEHGHSVVTTVRSQEKANTILAAHPDAPKSKLDCVIVEDIAQEGAFDTAVISDPPFEAVVHTASPFHFNITDTKKDLLDPAIIGTTSILKAIKKSAPTVKCVVITSSFAAILDPSKLGPGKTYNEECWNPITLEEAITSPANGYRASKTFAEKAAWKFLDEEKPNFTISTVNPPMVFGPVVHYLNSLSNLNTSNQRIRDIAFGQMKEKGEIPETGIFFWVDVRDIAIAHVKAMENLEAANKRFFITAGNFSNKEIVDIVRKNFPELKNNVPSESTKGGDYPKMGTCDFDNSRAVKVLGMKWTPLEKSIVDTVKSLEAFS